MRLVLVLPQRERFRAFNRSLRRSGYSGDDQRGAGSGGSSFGQTVSAIPGNVTGFFSNMFGGGSSLRRAACARVKR